VNGSDPSGMNALSGSAVADGCNASNSASCQAAWNQSRADITSLQSQEFPGFSFGDAFSAVAQGAVEGAVVGGGIGCLATIEVACVPGLVGGVIVGAIGGVIGGALHGVLRQSDYVDGRYIFNFERQAINTIYVDTYDYIQPYRQICSNNLNCVDATVLQFTAEFIVIQRWVAREFGRSAVNQAADMLYEDYGRFKDLNNLGGAIPSSYTARC
jgi:hypothetical protein